MQRPFCKHCKIAWSKFELDSVNTCTTCKSPVAKVSFYPISKIIGGLSVVIIGMLTIILMQIPIIWIGGIIIGFTLIINGLKEWQSLRRLDKKAKSKKEKSISKINKKFLQVTCGVCDTKINVRKGKGIVSIKCPECLGEYRVKS